MDAAFEIDSCIFSKSPTSIGHLPATLDVLGRPCIYFPCHRPRVVAIIRFCMYCKNPPCLVTCFFADWSSISGCVRKRCCLCSLEVRSGTASLRLKSLKLVRGPFADSCLALRSGTLFEDDIFLIPRLFALFAGILIGKRPLYHLARRSAYWLCLVWTGSILALEQILLAGIVKYVTETVNNRADLRCEDVNYY
jgi:hypothetical protein